MHIVERKDRRAVSTWLLEARLHGHVHISYASTRLNYSCTLGRMSNCTAKRHYTTSHKGSKSCDSIQRLCCIPSGTSREAPQLGRKHGIIKVACRRTDRMGHNARA